jgi:hypothetical protein
MKQIQCLVRRRRVLGFACLLVVIVLVGWGMKPAHAGWLPLHRYNGCGGSCNGGCCDGGAGGVAELGGNWYWLHSPDEEKRVVIGLYNRYCIRCHGVDGRGVWDIPDVPNFTNPLWQASRNDGEIARIIIEGRGAVMPPFRGTLSVEEAYGMARYLRTFVPGTEVSRPDLNPPQKGTTKPTVERLPAPPPAK